jgi:hypothetical protein
MRTLRRPMFRIGGKSEVGNDGIMTGLVDREKLKEGTAKEKFESVAPGFFGFKFDSPFLSIETPENRIGGTGGTGFGFMSPKTQSEGLTQIGEAISDRNPRMDELGLDKLAKPVRYSPSQEAAMRASDLEMGEGDLNLSPKDIKGLQEFYKTLNVKGNLDYKGGIPEVKTEVKDEDTSQITTKDTGSNVVTQAEKNAILKARAEEFEELLNPGARKRVINNALAAASGAFGKSTGNTMQDIANAITAAAGATSEIDKTKQKAAELAIGESIQKGIAKEKYKPGNYEFLVDLKKTDPETYKELIKSKDTDQDDIISLAKNYTGPNAVPKAIGDLYQLKADGANAKDYGGTLPVKLDPKSKTNIPDFNKMEAGKIYYSYTDKNFYKIGEGGEPEVTSKPSYLK